MDPIIKANLQIMESARPGGMAEAQRNESYGGNASTWRAPDAEGKMQEWSCFGANFYFVPDGERAGLITTFSNYRDATTDGRAHGSFRIASGVRAKFHSSSMRIVDCYLGDRCEAKALKRLQLSMQEWNRLHEYDKKLRFKLEGPDEVPFSG
jgi:hypothetical protein